MSREVQEEDEVFNNRLMNAKERNVEEKKEEEKNGKG